MKFLWLALLEWFRFELDDFGYVFIMRIIRMQLGFLFFDELSFCLAFCCLHIRFAWICLKLSFVDFEVLLDRFFC